VLRYNWQRIFNQANGSAVECYRIFKMVALREIPKNTYDPIYKYIQTNFRGESFLKHPEVLLYNSYRFNRRDFCIYVALASQRSYAAYQSSDTLTLELIHSRIDPRVHLDNIKLLPVKDGLIHFPYEEDTATEEIK